MNEEKEISIRDVVYWESDSFDGRRMFSVLFNGSALSVAIDLHDESYTVRDSDDHFRLVASGMLNEVNYSSIKEVKLAKEKLITCILL